jgi:hypothetical protein
LKNITFEMQGRNGPALKDFGITETSGEDPERREGGMVRWMEM